MTFNRSQKRRFFQVYPQDSLTTVGRFTLKGTLVAQRSLFHDGAGEITKVCESGRGGHAEELFLSEYVTKLTTAVDEEKATLSLNITITYSPCSRCRTELKNFFASLPQDKNSCYNLCIQFANLYHERKNSTDDEIKQLAAWSQSLEDINVNTVFKPLHVSRDPEFSPTDLGISHDIIKERETKDMQVSGHVQQIIEQKKAVQQLSCGLKKLSINPSLSSKANELKMQGNASLQKGDLPMAIQFYTKAIEQDPTNHMHVLYSNRSLAFCREKRYKRALDDADTSIRLKADWTKGHCHRGMALMHLKQFSAAVSAYEQALRIEPKNQEIKNALSVVNEKLMAASGLSKDTAGVPSRPPTKAQIQEQRTRATMEELHSDKKIHTLLRTGNALSEVPPAVRKALANCTSNKELSSHEDLSTEVYVIHHEKIKLSNGSVRCLSLHTCLEFSHQNVTGSGKVKIITRYYKLIYEWK